MVLKTQFSTALATTSHISATPACGYAAYEREALKTPSLIKRKGAHMRLFVSVGPFLN